MRRIIVIAIMSLSTLAACSPYDTPAAAETVTTAPSCDRACWTAVIERQRNERLYWAEVVKRQQREAEAARIARIYAFAHAIEQHRLARLVPTGYGVVQGIRVCNGTTLPTCGIVQRESRFNPNARNPSSSAWGLYQFLRGTWNGVCPEYRHGSASVAQQVECARRLWNGGRGSGHWRLTR